MMVNKLVDKLVMVKNHSKGNGVLGPDEHPYVDKVSHVNDGGQFFSVVASLGATCLNMLG